MREVTLAELQAKLADPRAAVVNVLVPDYFRIAHIPGSMNMPLDDIKTKVRERFPKLDQEIITYCGSRT